jgi:hypothetical protein
MFLNVSYWEWAGYIIGMILVVLVSLPNGMLKRFENYFSSGHLHQKISSMGIKQGTLVQKQFGNIQERTLGTEEIKQVIAWFNEAKFIDKISKMPDEQSCKLSMESPEERIEIQPYGDELMIYRKNRTDQKPILYWVQQAELRKWLLDIRED